MQLKERQHDNAVILEMAGELHGGPDTHNFKDKLKQLLDLGKKNFVIDLRKVTYVNSSGIGMLVTGMTTVTQAGGKFKLANAEKNIHNVFVITNLIKVFDTYESVPDAIRSF
ncbi:MAG: STAS domain-containing protein [Chlorobiales bacterium]|jgi:anti-sigma B factor antagonist|nr:STAS domain-containing protein [Chlorobiales bacterium]